jgi:hypothetical protein
MRRAQLQGHRMNPSFAKMTVIQSTNAVANNPPNPRGREIIGQNDGGDEPLAA